jgi:hypothetical protein
MSSATAPRPKNLTAKQALFLDMLLRGVPFTEACKQLGIFKQHGTILLGHLREHGLVVAEPSVPHQMKLVDPKKDAAAVWWEDPHTGEEWVVTAVPVGRYERADLAPNRHVVLVQAGSRGEFALHFTNRARVRYPLVEQRLEREGIEMSDGQIRLLTETIAYAIGVEAVLPAWFTGERVGA